MQLPIDLSVIKRPIKPKYVTEETPMLKSWMIFGVRSGGAVDINDGTDDIFTGVPQGLAKKILAARDRFCAEIERLLCTP